MADNLERPADSAVVPGIGVAPHCPLVSQSLEQRRQAVFDRCEVVDPGYPAGGQCVGDDQNVDVGIGPHGAASDRPVDHQGDEAFAVVSTDFVVEGFPEFPE